MDHFSGLLITSGFDKKLLSRDIRTKKSFSLLMTLDAEIDSMSLNGFKVTLGIGASAHVYDLRKFDKPNLSMVPCNCTQLRCVSSIPYAEGFAVGSVDGRVALQVSYSSNLNDIGYTFRCHPKSKDGQHHLASVNDIVFSPLVSGAFVTGDDEGYATIWDARSRKRLVEFPRFSNSVASLSYNHLGQLLAIASSYTYQEAKEMVEPPQVFIHNLENIDFGSISARRKT
ncbi:Transducin/WD40 repeat superfamily protein [Trifolium repens]|nr:Transducin/WD40 repeat superfamily protein [Trifolium repens]